MNKKLAVIGRPIEHSKSPEIHLAAYKTLGVDWSYERCEVASGNLASFASGLDSSWLGLSVTMPLKHEAVRFAQCADDATEITGVANTLLQTPAGWQCFNTDVFGITEALRRRASLTPDVVTILGAGATAASALFAASNLYPKASFVIVARNSEQAKDLKQRFSALPVKTRSWSVLSKVIRKSDVIISTLPSRALDSDIDRMRRKIFARPGGLLFDIAYDPWPSAAATWWQENNLPVINGLEMLIFQAIGQCRLFYHSDQNLELPNERAVEFAMRHSLGIV